MMIFNANPRDGVATLSGACGTCCCQPATARPGEVNPWMIDYAAWSVPIGGRGLAADTKATVETLLIPDTVGAPVADFFAATMAVNATLAAQQLVVTDPNGDGLTFALLPWYGPEHGEVTLTEAGLFSYTPTHDFVGVDRFFFSVTDGKNTVVQEVAIRVNGLTPSVQFPAPSASPMLEARDFKVDPAGHLVRFSVAASPAAKIGSIYRMTVRQSALDCDCKAFVNIGCYDVQIMKC